MHALVDLLSKCGFSVEPSHPETRLFYSKIREFELAKFLAPLNPNEIIQKFIELGVGTAGLPSKPKALALPLETTEEFNSNLKSRVRCCTRL
jgi:hypothetical protein